MTPEHPLDGLLDEMLHKATELVVCVRDRDNIAVAALLAPLTVMQLRALAICTSVLVPDDASFSELIAWTHRSDPLPELEEQLPYDVLAPGEKRCGGCEQIRSEREFHIDRSRRDGLFARCKHCRRDATARQLREASECGQDVTGEAAAA